MAKTKQEHKKDTDQTPDGPSRSDDPNTGRKPLTKRASRGAGPKAQQSQATGSVGNDRGAPGRAQKGGR